MATYLADRVIVFTGQPSIDAKANTPESLLTGCNKFLKNLDVTFRRDPNNFRPRINKHNSQMDQEQKLNGNFVSTVLSVMQLTIAANGSASSSWKMIVEKGVPNESQPNNEVSKVGDLASSGARKSSGMHGAGLLDDEICSDEDDEDDILRRRQSTSCFPTSSLM